MGPPRAAVGSHVDAAVAQETTLLSAADRDLIKAFQDSLSAEAAKGRNCGGLLTAILRHLSHFKEQVQVAGSKDEASIASPSLPDVWGPVIAEENVSHQGHKVSITGPGPDDRFEVPVSGPGDASHMVSTRVSNH